MKRNLIKLYCTILLIVFFWNSTADACINEGITLKGANRTSPIQSQNVQKTLKNANAAVHKKFDNGIIAKDVNTKEYLPKQVIEPAKQKIKKNAHQHISFPEKIDYINSEPKMHYACFGETPARRCRLGQISYGVEVGMNMTGLLHRQTDNMINGYHTGITINVCLGNYIAFQPGIIYFQKGNQTKSVLSDLYNDCTIFHTNKLHYLEFPLNIVYKMGKWNDNRFIAGGGPYFALLLQADEKNIINNFANTEGSVSLSHSVVVPANNNFHPLDYGINAFIGCEIPHRIFFKAGAQIGFHGASNNTDNNYGFLVSAGVFIN